MLESVSNKIRLTFSISTMTMINIFHVGLKKKKIFIIVIVLSDNMNPFFSRQTLVSSSNVVAI